MLGATRAFMMYGNAVTTLQVITIPGKLYPRQYNNVIMVGSVGFR